MSKSKPTRFAIDGLSDVREALMLLVEDRTFDPFERHELLGTLIAVAHDELDGADYRELETDFQRATLAIVDQMTVARDADFEGINYGKLRKKLGKMRADREARAKKARESS